MSRLSRAWNELRGKSSASEDVHQFPLSPTINRGLFRDLTALNLYAEGYRVNSAVFAVITKRASAVKEAPIVIWERDKYNPFSSQNEPVSEGILFDLLNRPNPIYSKSRYISIAEIYRCIGGQMYHHMVRDSYGQIYQMYPYHASQISPVAGRNLWTEFYLYDNGVDKIQIPASDICVSHWDSINPVRPQFSVPPLVALAAEIDVDNERARMALALLLNGATPSYALTAPEGVIMTQQEIDTQSAKLAEKFGNKNRGKAMVLPNGTTVTKLGFSPKEMATGVFEEIPVTRLCEVFQYPIQMTSFAPGLKASTHDTYDAMLRNFYGGAMVSTWNGYGDELTHFFGKEKLMSNNGAYMVNFDTRYVSALRESSDRVLDRNLKKFQGGIITLNEARLGEALEPDSESGELYAWQLTGAQSSDQAAEESKQQLSVLKTLAKHNTNGYYE